MSLAETELQVKALKEIAEEIRLLRVTIIAQQETIEALRTTLNDCIFYPNAEEPFPGLPRIMVGTIRDC